MYFFDSQERGYMKIKHLFSIIVSVLAISMLIVLICNRNNDHAVETIPKEVENETTSTTIPATVPEKPEAVRENQKQYEQLQQFIEDGKGYDFAMFLLESDVSSELFLEILNEDPAAIEYAMVDAMVSLAKEGRIQEIVLLRRNGFISDNCFLDYWEVMGSVLPETDAVGVDPYLVHELSQAYHRDNYAIRSFNAMRTAGILEDELHHELIKALGFDYSDSAYVEQNHLSPLQNLTEEEKVSYEQIMEAIDQGDSLSIVEKMCLGSVSHSVYGKLRENDADIMDYVIAEGMAHLVEMMRYQDVVHLRLDGFVSDKCFEKYWEIIGSDLPDETKLSNESDDVDTYLVYELKQIFYREDNGREILQNLWYSGLISDATQQKLIQILGFDYTKS